MFEGESQVYWIEGGFSEYDENRTKRLGGRIVPHGNTYWRSVRG